MGVEAKTSYASMGLHTVQGHVRQGGVPAVAVGYLGGNIHVVTGQSHAQPVKSLVLGPARCRVLSIGPCLPITG